MISGHCSTNCATTAGQKGEKLFCNFLLVPAVADFKPSNLGSVVDCFTNCTTTAGQKGGELFHNFLLVPAAAGFKPSNLGPVVDCSTTLATTAGQEKEKTLKVDVFLPYPKLNLIARHSLPEFKFSDMAEKKNSLP
jgi:hypothetical protein